LFCIIVPHRHVGIRGWMIGKMGCVGGLGGSIGDGGWIPGAWRCGLCGGLEFDFDVDYPFIIDSR